MLLQIPCAPHHPCHSVSVLDKQPGIALDALKTAGASVVLGSITDHQVVADRVQGAEVVMHLAAAFRETGAPDSLYREVNVEGTRVVVVTCASSNGTCLYAAA